jgi:glucose dehydrogenase
MSLHRMQWAIKRSRRILLTTGYLVTSTLTSQAQVTFERILDAEHEPQNWLTYSGTYKGWRYSSLDQIAASNSQNLTLQWVFQTAALGQLETTPLVIDGVLYGTGQANRAFAVDARTGRAIWRYQRHLPDKLQPCCGMVNRGFAASGDKLFMATLDGHVIALDRVTGNVVWDVTAADSRQAYVFTGAPLLVRNKIIVGVAGGEYGVRGFISTHTMSRPEDVPGVSTRFRAPANPATKPGRGIPGKLAEPPLGSQGLTIPSSGWFIGRLVIHHQATTAEIAAATICIATACWRSTRIPAN